MLACLALAGCYISREELISASDAVFPYQRIVFAEVGSESTPEDHSVLVRQGDSYRSDDAEDPGEYRFKRVAADTYALQVAMPEDPDMPFLFAFVKLDPAAGIARAYKIIADESETAPGMTKCNDGSLCFDRLDAYVAHAQKAIAAGAEPDAEYKIIEAK